MLTKAQVEVLSRMAEGAHITYSEDGERAWFYPGRDFLKISDEELRALREGGFIASDPDDEAYRFPPADVITEAGHAALQGASR